MMSCRQNAGLPPALENDGVMSVFIDGIRVGGGAGGGEDLDATLAIGNDGGSQAITGVASITAADLISPYNADTKVRFEVDGSIKIFVDNVERDHIP
jgi:hypothetical protein